jgi:hypothetical protein
MLHFGPNKYAAAAATAPTIVRMILVGWWIFQTMMVPKGMAFIPSLSSLSLSVGQRTSARTDQTFCGGGSVRVQVGVPLATAKKAPIDDDISRLQLKAQQLLERSKAKLASKEEKEKVPSLQRRTTSQVASMGANKGKNGDTAAATTTTALPFFATSVRNRDGVIKSRNAETGLVTADGERMAALSEKEEWEARSLLEVFENEIEENEDVYSLTSQQLAKRDVAASIFDLRKQLQTDDYKKIFNTRNPFIGEDN